MVITICGTRMAPINAVWSFSILMKDFHSTLWLPTIPTLIGVGSKSWLGVLNYFAVLPLVY